ncbi:MAG TPA: hypothetical protein VIX20_16815 [Ktedonobacteraceae bacterium]
MNQQVAWKGIKDVEEVIRRVSRNTTCLFPGCDGSPIGSHVIARKTLELIADQGHVLTWLPRKVTAWDMMRSISEGRPLEQLYEKPISIGIRHRNKVTEPLFCHDHDNRVFDSLENEEFSFKPEQVLLLAFRALCSMLLSTSRTEAIFTALVKQHGYQNSLSTLETLIKWQRFQETELALNIRKRYEQIRKANDYDQLGWSMYVVNRQPCIAATYSIIPFEGNEAMAIINGRLATSVEDEVIFSFLPCKPMDNSICVISWLKESRRAQRFMTSHRINELSEKEQLDLFFSLAFESPTLYISPTWWQSLSDEEREVYKNMHLNAHRKHANLLISVQKTKL